MNTPIRATCPRCCAHVAIGHMTVVLLRSVMNSRRLIRRPETEDKPSYGKIEWLGGVLNVCFGSKADIRAAKSHFRFTPNSGQTRIL
ncbi:MAG: hypothetical protein WBL81_00330 [Pseudolabrys sp.]